MFRSKAFSENTILGEKSYPGHPPKTEKSKKNSGKLPKENQTGYHFRLELPIPTKFYVGGKTECLYKQKEEGIHHLDKEYTVFGEVIERFLR